MKKLFFLNLGLLLSLNTMASESISSQPVLTIANFFMYQHTQTFEEPNLTIHIQYPLFSDGELLRVKRFNELIKQVIECDINQFRALVGEAKVKAVSSLDTQYQVTLKKAGENSVISIRFNTLSYVAGGAYPNFTHRTFNYNFLNGNIIPLISLFKPKSKFMKMVDEYCAKELTLKTSQTRKEMEDSSELIYSNWNMTPKGFLFTFDEFPHVLGTQEVLVPYSFLKDELKPNALIAPCAEDPKNCE